VLLDAKRAVARAARKTAAALGSSGYGRNVKKARGGVSEKEWRLHTLRRSPWPIGCGTWSRGRTAGTRQARVQKEAVAPSMPKPPFGHTLTHTHTHTQFTHTLICARKAVFFLPPSRSFQPVTRSHLLNRERPNARAELQDFLRFLSFRLPFWRTFEVDDGIGRGVHLASAACRPGHRGRRVTAPGGMRGVLYAPFYYDDQRCPAKKGRTPALIITRTAPPAKPHEAQVRGRDSQGPST
jgi:hypothetical protein